MPVLRELAADSPRIKLPFIANQTLIPIQICRTRLNHRSRGRGDKACINMRAVDRDLATAIDITPE